MMKKKRERCEFIRKRKEKLQGLIDSKTVVVINDGDEFFVGKLVGFTENKHGTLIVRMAQIKRHGDALVGFNVSTLEKLWTAEQIKEFLL